MDRKTLGGWYSLRRLDGNACEVSNLKETSELLLTQLGTHQGNKHEVIQYMRHGRKAKLR